MNEMIRNPIATGVCLNNIKETKFKSVRISVTMIVPLEKDTAAAYSLLPSVLTYSCAKYPDTTALNKVLASLYGAGLGGYCRKIGEALAVTVGIFGIDDRYTIDNETVSSKLVALLCEVLFNPKTENKAFCEKDFEQCKRQLLEAIDGEFNDKRGYAIAQMLTEMCREEKFGIRKYVSRQAVENLRAEDLYQAWETILRNSRVEIMVVGNNDNNIAKQIFTEKFSAYNRTVPEITTEIRSQVDKVKTVLEVSDIAQAKLVMGFRTPVARPSIDTIAMSLTIAILGGTPSSKFFLNIREKLSLCYYCAARYDKYKGIVIVDSGVEKDNVEKTIEEIKNQLDEMKKGNISDFEIDSAKLAIINGYKSVPDTLSGTENWYFGQLLDENMMSVEECITAIKNVDKDTIVRLANTIVLDTVYRLQPCPTQKEEA